MQVLIYSPYSLKFCGGGERWIIEVASRLALLGYKITIVTTRFGENINPSPDLKLPDKVTLVELPFIKSSYLGLFLPIPVYFRRLHRLFKSADVIYFNNIFAFQELIMLGVKLIYKKPIINMYQAPIYARSALKKIYQSVISRYTVRFFDAQHVLNEADKKILIKWKVRNIHYIPNGVAVDKFVPSKTLSNAKFKVLFVGRLNYHKGIDILLKIVEIINCNEGASSNIEFSIIGNGFFKPKAEDLEKHYENVKCLGQVSHESLTNLYSAASLLVMPSRWEGMPLVGLEAQSSGLPIVASNVPGLQDLAFNNESIALVKPEDPDAFTKAIDKYYNLWESQRSVYERLKHKARDNAYNTYGWDRIADLVSNLLNTCANKHR